jgi:23S rRNA pseudouridine2605 synthase
LANAGVGSRRQIERWISAGRIVVDGQRAALGQPLTGKERVLLDGRPLKLGAANGPHGYLAYYKPAGELTTRDDPERRPTLFAALPKPPRGRWISIGRLDFNTQGLLLLTTDGELAHRLMHPRYGIPREYAVRLLGRPTEQQLRQLAAGVELDDGPARFDRIEQGGGTGANEWLHVTLREGRNREVRRMFEALNLTVSRLIRVRYGPVQLDKLQRGRSRPLTASETDALYAAVDLRRPAALTQ